MREDTPLGMHLEGISSRDVNRCRSNDGLRGGRAFEEALAGQGEAVAVFAAAAGALLLLVLLVCSLPRHRSLPPALCRRLFFAGPLPSPSAVRRLLRLSAAAFWLGSSPLPRLRPSAAGAQPVEFCLSSSKAGLVCALASTALHSAFAPCAARRETSQRALRRGRPYESCAIHSKLCTLTLGQLVLERMPDHSHA